MDGMNEPDDFVSEWLDQIADDENWKSENWNNPSSIAKYAGFPRSMFRKDGVPKECIRSYLALMLLFLSNQEAPSDLSNIGSARPRWKFCN